MSQLLQFYKSFQQARMPAAKAAPTFEDLSIDDKLNEHQRVVRYVKSTIGLQRLVHVKMIADVAQNIGFSDTVDSIVPLLDALSKDSEPVVKQHLVEQLKYLAKFLHSSGAEEGYRIVRDKLLPLTATLLEDEKQEVRSLASMTLVEIAQLIRPDDIGQYVLTIILRLAHEDDKEEMRMTAAQLLNLLAESLGQDLCRQFVIPEVVSLAEDPVFRVRKSTALNFHSICKVGGEHELLERLMPAFVRLSKDDMYRVRRACAESLSEIAKNVNEDIRLGVLVEIFLRLTHDPSKLVKQTILQQSGTFIATLPSRAVNETILNQYISMANSPTGDVAADAELRHICAYSFPAVLQVIGKDRWEDIRELYHSLAQTRSVNIKQTLAYSLHEIARILEDGQVVEEELVSIFEELVQDVEVVQMGIIKHLAPFLSSLPALCRVSYLPTLYEILHTTNPFNWRLRQNLAVQLPLLVALPNKQDVHRTLFPTIMTLLQDPVASVRRETFHGVSSFITAINDVATNKDNEYSPADVANCQRCLSETIKAINDFITSDKCYIRQLWAELALQLMKDLPRDLFEQKFLFGILQLTCDRVLNVRLAVAIFFAGWSPEYIPPWESEDNIENKSYRDWESSPWLWLLQRSDIKTCIERLSKDDRDVFLRVSQLQSVYPDIDFQMVSCRGRKTPPGGATAISLDANPVPAIDRSSLSSSISEKERPRSFSNVSSKAPTLPLEERSSRIHNSLLDEEDNDVDDTFKEMSKVAMEIDAAGPVIITSRAVEHEYMSSLLDESAVAELDIIDGIMKSPAMAPVNSLSSNPFRVSRDSDEEDEEPQKVSLAADLSISELSVDES